GRGPPGWRTCDSSCCAFSSASPCSAVWCGPARPYHGWGAGGQSPTVMPIDRAVPAMILAAASGLVAFRSVIFDSAISRIWSAEMVPTFSECGVPEPLATPAAFLISSAAGGVLGLEEIG